MRKYLFPAILLITMTAFSQSASLPPIEPGVPLELAKWRAERYSDVRYKLNLTLEKMSPVLKGTMEIRVVVRDAATSGRGDAATSGRPATGTQASPPASAQGADIPPIILDWRMIRGHEEKSTITNVSINGRSAARSSDTPVRMSVASTRKGANAPESLNGNGSFAGGTGDADKSVRAPFEEHNEHLIFREGVVAGENVIKLDFTSPILTSGSAITRYVDKEDGSEYIYSLFVPSDASTAFPVFDQPDLKARFELTGVFPDSWTIVSNSSGGRYGTTDCPTVIANQPDCLQTFKFEETKPISTYVFAFAAGPFEAVEDENPSLRLKLIVGTAQTGDPLESRVFVRKSQVEKFKPHAEEVFRLNRRAVRYFEEYFDYRFPFPKYDLVLIPEFPFGGMEHAGATFLRESSIIFPQEPTKNDHISRALLIFHEASHQWFGDTVTMRWFDDLWLKEGFATFTAYKAMERIMPEMNAWKVFYERVKQAAYQTDSTKGTTPIYQEIPNLSAAKSAYGNIVYNKAPAFLRQAEFYLGEDKFQTAVRAFLKKHEFGNAGWEDLVEEFATAAWFDARRIYHPRDEEAFRSKEAEAAQKKYIREWASSWVSQPGLPTIRVRVGGLEKENENDLLSIRMDEEGAINGDPKWKQDTKMFIQVSDQSPQIFNRSIPPGWGESQTLGSVLLSVPPKSPVLVFPNYDDYGYGIFLLDEKSRDYVLKNIQNEKDPFLRSMMWGALWDSVREGELDPREFVDLVVKVLQKPAREQGLNGQVESQALANARASAIEDESTTALLLSRVGTAMNYYIDAENKGRGDAATETLQTRVEDLLIERMRNAETLGQRITLYRAFLNVAASENGRKVLKELLTAETQRRGDDTGGNPSGSEGVSSPPSKNTLPTGRVSASDADKNRIAIPLKTKDKFDIVTRLLILRDPEAEKLLAELEKTETSDDAKRYAYAARAGIATAENKAKYWNDFVNNKEISESWIEAAFGPWNSIRHSELTMPYLQKALQELPNHKRNRKIFFVNGWLGAFIGGQRSEEALATINKFLAENPTLDRDLRLKILENADVIERAVKIRSKFAR